MPALWPTSRRPPALRTEAVVAPSFLVPLLCASYASSHSPFCRTLVAGLDLSALEHDAIRTLPVPTSQNSVRAKFGELSFHASVCTNSGLTASATSSTHFVSCTISPFLGTSPA